MLTSAQTLPDNARIWIFPAERKLSSIESNELLLLIDQYLADWKAHGAPVRASRELLYDQFLIVMADPEVTAPSGCSIDDMTRAIKGLSAKFGVDFFGAMKVFYRVGDEIRVTDRAGFKALAREGKIDEKTVVFDHSITALSALREEKWELPAGKSWHSSLLTSTLTLA